MPLNHSLVDADDFVDVLHGVLSALMLVLLEAVRETCPADAQQNNGYCHTTALHTLRLNDLEDMGVLRGHARMIMSALRPGGDLIHPRRRLPLQGTRPQPMLQNPRAGTRDADRFR